MPELPDVTVYAERIGAKVAGRRIERIRIINPFVLRSVDPPVSEMEGKSVDEITRIGKRIAIGVDGDLWLLADRGLSRLLKQDWPKPIDEL